MVREILIWPDTLLARKCEAVTDFADPVLKQLLQDMEATMLANKGAGLAANQVGFALRAVVLLVKEGATRRVLKLVNPRIVESKGLSRGREGCLSLPGYFDDVPRARWVRVEAQDEDGGALTVEGDGFLGRALQHELEHLEGRVFVDNVSPLKRTQAFNKFQKAKKRGLRYRADSPQPQDFTAPPA